jgi:hypothetical protein
MQAWRSCVTWRRSTRARGPGRVLPVALRLRGPREDAELACPAAAPSKFSRARCRHANRPR